MRHVLRVPPTVTGLYESAASLGRFLETRHLAETARYNIELVFEEIVTNIIRHGQSTADIAVELVFNDAETILTFEDNGVPFNPQEHSAQPVPTSVDDVQVGGLGITLVKKIASRMEYERTKDRNRLLVAIPAR